MSSGLSFDVQGQDTCVGRLQKLFDAYTAAITGNVRVVVRFNDRWSEYARPDAPKLLELYMTLYTQCPGASAAGLPDLNPQNKVRRGPPARGRFRW